MLNKTRRWTTAMLVLIFMWVPLGVSATVSQTGSKAAPWHPGHYVLMSSSSPTTNDLAAAMSLSSKFRGVQVMFSWKSLDSGPSSSVNFTPIQNMIDWCQVNSKHLVIQVQTKSFASGDSYVPSYVVKAGGSAKPGGGKYSATYETSYKSLYPVFWDPAVSSEIAAFYKRLAARINQLPVQQRNVVESVVLSETATSTNNALLTQSDAMPYTDTAYIQHLTYQFATLNSALPNTSVIQYTNFPDSILAQLTDNEEHYGVGTGSPDLDPTSRHKNLQGPGQAYSQILKLAGAVPLGIAVQASDEDANPGAGGVTNVFALAQRLKLNYVYWQERGNYLNEVASFLNDKNNQAVKDPAGGLVSTYPRCVQPLVGAQPIAGGNPVTN